MQEEVKLPRVMRQASSAPDDSSIEVVWTSGADDVAAMRDAIRSGLRSPQDIIAEMGRDWRETAEYYALCDGLQVIFARRRAALPSSEKAIRS